MTEIKCYCGHTINCDCVPLKKQTAVEWLIDMLITENEVTLKGENFKLFEMAKAMEKEQIIDCYTEANTELTNEDGSFITGEQYYNETFKQDK